MTNIELEAALRPLSWTAERLAEMLEIADGLARDWVSGAQPIPDPVGAWLTAITVPPPALDFVA